MKRIGQARIWSRSLERVLDWRGQVLTRIERFALAVLADRRIEKILAFGAVVAILTAALGNARPVMRLLLVALAVLLLASIWALRHTTGWTGRLAEAATALAEGRLDDFAAQLASAEPGTGYATAAEALGAVARRIEELLESHERVGREGGPELERLAATTQQLSAAGQEVAATVQELSDDAGAKAAAVQRAAEAGEMISAATREVVLGVTEAAQLNAVTHELAEAQQAAIVESARSVQAFIDDVRATVAGLNDLSAAAERTAGFVDTIRSINRQTNILALNAAIEAARFGESAHGFTVVADEVRKLAESATAAAVDIQAVVRDSSRAMGRLSAMLTGCVRTGEVVALAVDEAAAGFRAVVDQTRNAADHMVVIQAGAEEIERQVEINTGALEELSAEITEVAAATEELSATAEEMAAGLAELADATTRIQYLLRPEQPVDAGPEPGTWREAHVGSQERSGETDHLRAHEWVHA